MKRFYKEVAVRAADGGWQVALDGRALKTAGGRAQIVPSRALAEAMAKEWRGQGEEIDPRSFFLRDLADHAIDHAAADRAGTIRTVLRYAETDTLCYRADPGEPLRERQEEAWEPLLRAAEARYKVRFERIGGVVHRAQPDATLARMERELFALDDFTLAAAENLASLACSLTIALAALDKSADAEALWGAANLEEDWQAVQWGWDSEALARRSEREAAFARALRFATLASERG